MINPAIECQVLAAEAHDPPPAITIFQRSLIAFFPTGEPSFPGAPTIKLLPCEEAELKRSLTQTKTLVVCLHSLTIGRAFDEFQSHVNIGRLQRT